MNIHKQLQSIGLTKSEVVIYIYVLEYGISSPPHIAKATGIARTNCYTILSSLRDKGLIEQQISRKRKMYIASDPQALLRALEQKKEMAQRILPDLRALYTIQKNKPTIHFYDGAEQVKQIYLQSFEATEVLAVGSSEKLLQFDPKFYNYYFKKVRDSNIVMRDITSFASGETAVPRAEEILKGLYDTKQLPKRYGEVETDMLIWNDHIAFIIFEEPIFGTVLTSPTLAKTFRLMFEVMRDAI